MERSTRQPDYIKEALAQLDIREAKAWDEYKAALEGMDTLNSQYRDAESREWDELQRCRRVIAKMRQRLDGGT